MMGSILWDDSLRRRNINGYLVGNVLESALDTTREEGTRWSYHSHGRWFERIFRWEFQGSWLSEAD